MPLETAGTILAERHKGAVVWQARISQDRGRLEVVGIVPASTTETVIEPLTEPELRQLLDDTSHDDHGHIGRIDVSQD